MEESLPVSLEISVLPVTHTKTFARDTNRV